VSGNLLITSVNRIEAVCNPRDWRWAKDNRALIAANWAERTADKPQMFNGRVLLGSDLTIGPEVCTMTYFETDFADFLGWRDLGYPDRGVTNGFSMGALQGSDGAYICGVMGAHTANEGRVYFPSGTPDPSDLRPDGTVDLATSVVRELEEETLLTPDAYRIADNWVVVYKWPAAAFLRPIGFAEPADEVANRIRANIARQDDPELSDVKVIRSMHDVDPLAVPLFLQAFFEDAFALTDIRSGTSSI
jgi:8-oxo-dGTP pyrophosphatase MutT (NUDIX family)